MTDFGPKPTRSLSVWCAGVFAGVAVAQVLSAALWNHQYGTHIVWFPGAVLLGALIVSPPRRWAALSVTAWLGLLITGMAFGLPAGDTALVVAAAVLLVPGGAWLLYQLPRDLPRLEDFRWLTTFVVVAVVILPAVDAALVAYASRFTSFQGSVLSDWPNIAVAHALGYALYVPMWKSLRDPESAVRQTRPISLAWLALMALGLAAVTAVWWWIGNRPGLVPVLCLAPAPLVIAAIVRAQMPGSSITIFIVALIAAHMSALGRGPFVADTPPASTLAVQLWSLVGAMCGLILCVVVEQRSSGRRALQRAHSDLREMAGRLIATQEQERARLARDLHDDINQRLAASSISLSALRRQVDPALGDDVNHLREVVVSVSEDVRQLSHQLHPSILEHTGLRAAMAELCNTQRRPHTPEIMLITDRALNGLPHDVALCIYRVTQEAIANALRHSAATRLTIKVSVDHEGASLWIFDNGRGFDPNDDHGRPGMGLISMNERAKLLGGRFELRTAPGKGVDLWMHLPLETP